MSRTCNFDSLHRAYWAFHVDIPIEDDKDTELVEELANYLRGLLEKKLILTKVSDESRRKLLSHMHVSVGADETLAYFKQAADNDENACIVLAFNASQATRKLDRIGVISLKWLGFTRNSWRKLKKKFELKDLKKVLKRFFKCCGHILCQQLCNFLISAIINGLSHL